jgi:hypothetical protein
VLANMHSLSLREIASHFAHKQKQEALRILRVLHSPVNKPLLFFFLRELIWYYGDIVS